MRQPKEDIKDTILKVMLFIGIAIVFNIGIYFIEGQQKAIEFLGGYLMELSLSVDNLFVFLTIFSAYGIKEHAQHRVLGWGIVGAIILRFIFIFVGIRIVTMFEWILYIFGVILIINGIKMLKNEEEKDPKDSKIMKGIGKVLPMTHRLHGDKFMVKKAGKKFFTPLFAVLCLIELSDILFAVDSVPAVFTMSRDVFIVYTSNIFAILGLRQMYFVLEHMANRFAYVRFGVACILIFTGIKMLVGFFEIEISTLLSIGIIFAILVGSIVISLIVSKKQENKGKSKVKKSKK